MAEGRSILAVLLAVPTFLVCKHLVKGSKAGIGEGWLGSICTGRSGF